MSRPSAGSQKDMSDGGSMLSFPSHSESYLWPHCESQEPPSPISSISAPVHVPRIPLCPSEAAGILEQRHEHVIIVPNG